MTDDDQRPERKARVSKTPANRAGSARSARVRPGILAWAGEAEEVIRETPGARARDLDARALREARGLYLPDSPHGRHARALSEVGHGYTAAIV
jgi:hypothetical protein